MVPCRVIYLFGQGKGAQARGWTDEGGTVRGAPRFLRGARAPPPPSDAPVRPSLVLQKLNKLNRLYNLVILHKNIC